MSQNLVIANKDNLVVYVFGGIDLTAADDIKVVFGAETYTLQLNPTIVIRTSATTLSLNLSATAEVGTVFSTVTYFDGASVNGTDITSQELGNSDQIVVAIGTQLIIEDGSQVTNANSFVTDLELKNYASLRGLVVPATQPARESLLIQAMDYLSSVESSMKGRRTSSTQELLYPRVSVYVNGYIVNSDVIPNELKASQIELAIQANTDALLINETTTNLESFEVVGAYKEGYFKGGSSSSIRTGRASAYLDLLLNDTDKLVRT